jgi:predicted dehydrogenase
MDIPTPVTDLQEVFEDDDIDVVVVATPPTTHADIVVAAAEAGKHVMCEKPFAHSLDDAIRMRDAARDAGVVGAVGHEFRWLPTSVVSIEALRKGAIGVPRLFNHIRLSSALSAPGSSAPDWFQAKDSFGGWLNAEIQHVIDEIRTLMGEFATVYALEGQTTDHDWDVGDTFVVQFTTQDGAMGTLVSSTGSVGERLSVQRISGTKGSLWTNSDGTVSVDDGSGPVIVETPSTRAVSTDASADHEFEINEQFIDQMKSSNTLTGTLAAATSRLHLPTRLMYEAFRERILGTAQAIQPAQLATFDDGVKNTAVHMAVRKSVETGRPEKVSV